MQKWEYHAVVRNPYRDVVNELNTLGEDGWELVSIRTSAAGGNVFIFKREKRENQYRPERPVRLGVVSPGP